MNSATWKLKQFGPVEVTPIPLCTETGESARPTSADLQEMAAQRVKRDRLRGLREMNRSRHSEWGARNHRPGDHRQGAHPEGLADDEENPSF